MKIFEVDSNKIYYFAYGMLTNKNYMRNSKIVGVGIVNNFEFEMLRYANVYRKMNSKVYGLLWEINKKLLQELDHIEGYPILYDRIKVDVLVNDRTYTSEMYTMTQLTRKSFLHSEPSDSYIDTVVDGYKSSNIPLTQIIQALEKL